MYMGCLVISVVMMFSRFLLRPISWVIYCSFVFFSLFGLSSLGLCAAVSLSDMVPLPPPSRAPFAPGQIPFYPLKFSYFHCWKVYYLTQGLELFSYNSTYKIAI